MERKDREMPVLLIAGYLGSGKTTLLNRILSNTDGIRFAVIVNDIGEVNIDADLIQKGGIVGGGDGQDLVALQNGCICCTLRTDLMQQIDQLIATDRFDYIVIEASGVCDPAPIAQTICSMENMAVPGSMKRVPRLDCIVTVVDALRLKTEFGCGGNLARPYGEEDIENLIVSQIEFCNIVLLNKISEVSAEEAKEIRHVVRALQPLARIRECDYADVPVSSLVDTGLFDFETVATSASWVREIERPADEIEAENEADHHHHHHHHDEDEEHECHHHHNHDEEEGHEHHCHHHHGEHCHCHEGGETEEYGIGTFVYLRRRPFNFEKFDRFVNLHWPDNIIRSKGVVYFSQNRDMSLLFEQAGVQKTLQEAGLWFATASEAELRQLMKQEPGLVRDWDPKYGDRMEKIVFIGRHLDKEGLTRALDDCLDD